MKNYKFVPLIAGLFTSTLVITNILNTKIFVFLGFAFPAGSVTYPLSFLAADALTEVYGYRVTRQIIWSGFGALLLMVATVIMTIHLPAASFWQLQGSFEAILAQVPRIVVASILAYWTGEFCNSYVLAREQGSDRGTGNLLKTEGHTPKLTKTSNDARQWSHNALEIRDLLVHDGVSEQWSDRPDITQKNANFGRLNGVSGNYIGASSAQSPGAATSRYQVRLESRPETVADIAEDFNVGGRGHRSFAKRVRLSNPRQVRLKV